MFEFHGWATIRVSAPDIERRWELEAVAVARLREAIARADDQFSLFDVRQTSNELIVLYAHGLRNHRFEPVIDLFRWVAAELPDSYGLLYAHDDEAEGQDNEFRVWRLARGRLEERADPLLSPYTPTVQPPSPFTCDVLFAWLSLLDNLRTAYPEAVLEELADCVSLEQAAFLRRLADRAAAAPDAEPSDAPDPAA
ncbi:MAG: Imm7 family immunity protein [Gemmataceae bacterium]